ncbi:ACT domain-containing protein [Oceanicaulis sp. MMSF_3324]|uniref:ACT domain-containing protein n=1 Tax=Oceanicaulis sp. MMSF_3324 TaxID=3046702 RepID=UPI00273F2788|nr:ACT domain-containing protein [Oceanicaulis sp. MMSF_3324]
MTDRIEIEFRPSEGAILRLIGLVERRGFEVRGVELPQMNTQSDARMDLTVQPRDAGRKMSTLCAQISKIYGVSAVRSASLTPAYEAAS